MNIDERSDAPQIGAPSYVGARVRAARYLLGLSQGQLADRLGAASATNVSQWERGEYRIAPEFAIRLKRLSGVTLDFLYGDDASAIADARTRLDLLRHYDRALLELKLPRPGQN